ncbi:hypothetical protein Bbelb_221530 [Branchiostoma belcheri]|nr:hypothetical protein Bbelb_221530 [Branchiostoma belcheri]
MYGKERILAKPRFVNQTQPIEDGPPNIKMEGNDRQQANKDNITRPTNLENTTATSSANVVRTVEPQTMFASAERLSNEYVPVALILLVVVGLSQGWRGGDYWTSRYRGQGVSYENWIGFWSHDSSYTAYRHHYQTYRSAYYRYPHCGACYCNTTGSTVSCSSASSVSLRGISYRFNLTKSTFSPTVTSIAAAIQKKKERRKQHFSPVYSCPCSICGRSWSSFPHEDPPRQMTRLPTQPSKSTGDSIMVSTCQKWAKMSVVMPEVVDHSTVNREIRVRSRVVPGTCLDMRPDVVHLGKALYTTFLTPPRCEWVPNFGWGKPY